jgi:ATP-dependent Lhr-like helicase
MPSSSIGPVHYPDCQPEVCPISHPPGDPTPATALDPFGASARGWFEARFDAPTEVQCRGFGAIDAGDHALLIAPTGSGKTLAAFFACLDRLTRLTEDAEPGVRVLYVSPLKALVYDIERNLEAPLLGIRREAEARGESLRMPRVAVRTGDTPASERRRQARDPAEILVTTPESLYLILGSQQRETLRRVDTVIVDEVHALAGTKRGAHLALSLERVSAAASGADPQRVGLSATARPPEEVARFLGGDRPVTIVDASHAPDLDLEIRVPVPDMTRPDERDAHGEPRVREEGGEGGLWPTLYPELLAEIRAHHSTLLFVNSRALCERLAQRLNELAGEEWVRAHHGSLAHTERRQIEEALKAGTLRGIVATSSLELGIDMQAVDCVLLVESPGAVARGLQRVGRAGHAVDTPSRGRIYPKHRGDLLEATVVADGMRRGAVEALAIPRNPLDVLAQQIVAICASGPIALDDLECLVRRAASFRDLSREALCGVLDMLSGRYPSTDFAELRPRLVWDRETDHLEARRGSRQLALMSGGTIPDRGLYGVHLGPEGPRIGELDEEMVNETRVGEAITLGASTWRVAEITRDRVIVAPAPGEVGKLPFWRGEGPGRPLELGRALGAFVREVETRWQGASDDVAARSAIEAWLEAERGLDAYASRNLVAYLWAQREATGHLPSDRTITIERFRDELGDWRICILSPFGARLHAPWALALESLLSARGAVDVQTLWTDDGIVLRFADAEALPGLDLLVPDPEALEDRVVAQLGRSPLFAAQFRENAARALLLPRRRPGARTPLWAQRLRAQNLLAVARGFPAFPIVLETYRSCLQDVFDVPGLVELLRDVRDGRVRIESVETRSASPFARSLVFAYTAAYLYQGDSPAAERRAQALNLDVAMLRDLLGREDLRGLLDAEVIEATEAELQALTPITRARHSDALHDLLRRLGDLSREEIARRCDEDSESWLAALEKDRRVVGVEVGGATRWIAAEDAGLYRDALGVALPGHLPGAFLEPTERSLAQLATRFARQRGPFTAEEFATRFGLPITAAEALLGEQVAEERLVAGGFHPRGETPEWCDAEVLRRLRRRTLQKLRAQVSPVDASTLLRFLLDWHGLGAPGGGEARLHAALEQLEGLPLSFAELERLILPARVEGFDPALLDDLGRSGEWVWMGCGGLGDRDARIALYRRDRLALLADPVEVPEDLGPVQRSVLDHLTARGASFLSELSRAAGDPPLRALEDAMTELARRGLVTHDGFAPLRRLGAPRARSTGRSRRRSGGDAGSAGRWSALAPLFADAPHPTRRAHARARQLLERYGVVSRDAMGGEAIVGGFTGPYRVYRQMEESGKLRRGHFVEGLTGAQFADAGTVDRLRAARTPKPEQGIAVAATDPANPFGRLLAWPATRSEAATPRRAAGATVVVVDGDATLFLDRGRRIWSFAPTVPGSDAHRMERAARTLRQLFAHRRRRTLRIDEIDGVPATRSVWRDAFVAAGFRVDYKGMVLERSEALAAIATTPG